MVWSQESWPIAVFFLAVMILIYLLESMIVAYLFNFILRTPLRWHLLSSMAVGLVVFLVTIICIVFFPGQHIIYNGVPQNFRTWVAYNEGKIIGITVLVGIALWQAFIRTGSRSRSSMRSPKII